MKEENSFGVIPIYEDSRLGIKFLLIRHRSGHWAFPKGHAEASESHIETALRELNEETGLKDCHLWTHTQFRDEYVFTKRSGNTVRKRVGYYLGLSLTQRVFPQPEEVEDFRWLDAKAAEKLVTYEGSRRVLRAARQFLAKLKRPLRSTCKKNRIAISYSSQKSNKGGYMSVRVGDKIDSFEAEAYYPSGDIKKLSLSDYKGKWLVIFFYPLDFTFVCPTEIKAYSQSSDNFKKAGAEVVGVSTDSCYSHKAWTEAGLGKISFPLIGDTNHEISRLFGVLLEEKGIALRGTFIINPDGKIVSSVVNDLSVGRNVDETFRVLKGFQTGELIGCGWQPGQPALKV